MPQDIAFSDAYRQVVDQLFEDIVGFNGIILNLPPGKSALAREELLRSAIERPFTTIGVSYVYPDGLLQAAALLYSLIQNHPFADANKRTAYWACAYFLRQCGYWHHDIFLNHQEAFGYEKLVLEIAREGEDLQQGRITARYTVEAIADRLDRELAGSRNRTYSRRRERSGLFGYLTNLIRRGG